MPAFYSVIKYVPNPVADESINVGVVAFSGDEVSLRFTSDWARARQLSNRDPSILKQTVADLTSELKNGRLSEPTIRRYAETWHNQIQWSEPRPSLNGVDELVEEVATVYLPKFERKPPRRLGKRRAVKIAIDELTRQLTMKFHAPRSKARRLIRTDHVATGKLEQHELDVAIVNGILKTGAFALSFASTNRQQLKRDMDALAFGVEDVRRANKGVPLYVLGYTEDTDSEEVRRAQVLFRQLNSTFIPDSKIPAWSKSVVGKLPQDLLAHS